ncbi:HpcH/HpaI aldolase/citrate lyase family protein [Amycolatopsis sp. CA-230715]|uniref:HpcH/HpaI aldolase/citrate lyase family protein n=1 Tax=Amycolatopsis sp. CA-230715 TaxID=2745196 RepID=UPI001C332161|nr:CoA ester lyase [Amycolatopsis sp. CA-230715]QWF84892.1 Citrate lyase subunit beta-like protein [Amycolatopsis sp. CA-230715]
MTARAGDAATMLFVPGDRPDRFAKAAAAGADLVVLDLEDAVAPDRKAEARGHVARWVAGNPGCAVRVNAAETPWQGEDLAVVSRYECVVMLPKADPAAARAVTNELIALVETARGVLDAREVAAVPNVRRLAFGSFDLAAELGVDPADRDALAPARSALVLASAAAGLSGPVDGVTADLHDETVLTDDVRYARRLGFTGKLCVHPKQVPIAAAALCPTGEEVRWARSVLGAASHGGAAAVRGQLVDKPVLDRARRILRYAPEGNGR